MEKIESGKIQLGHNCMENRFLKRLGAAIEIVSAKEAYWVAPEGAELFFIGSASGGKEDCDANGQERQYVFYWVKLSDGREFPLRLDTAVMSPNYAVEVHVLPKSLQV